MVETMRALVSLCLFLLGITHFEFVLPDSGVPSSEDGNYLYINIVISLFSIFAVSLYWLNI